MSKSRSGYPRMPWAVVYFKRHHDDDPAQPTPGRDFLRNDCPPKVRAEYFGLIDTIAGYPPPAFRGGGFWESMKMPGYYQAKLDGDEGEGRTGRMHFRLFCLLEREAPGLPGPSLVVICGMKKPYMTLFTEREYDSVRLLGEEYRARSPRSIAS